MGPFQLQPSELAKIVVIVALASVIANFDSELDVGPAHRDPRRRRHPDGADPAAARPRHRARVRRRRHGDAAHRRRPGPPHRRAHRARHRRACSSSSTPGCSRTTSSAGCRRSSTENNDGLRGADATYNVDQAKIAIGSGGVLGKGPFNGTQTRLDLVPEQHTDFIFTAVGEELGFVGSATLLALLGVIAWRIWRTAQMARDPLGTLICVGVLSMFVFQVFENVGMTMGIMPVTGIPLPFMSYGGSSTLTAFVAIGLVLNVHMRRFS